MTDCWDYMDCPDETRAACPAYPDNGHDCWKMLSTRCGGGRLELASIAEKVAYCRNCEFYVRHVKSGFVQPNTSDKPARISPSDV